MPLLILSKDNFIFPKKEELRCKQVLRTKKDKTKMTKAHYPQYFFFLDNTHNTNLRNRRIKPWTPLWKDEGDPLVKNSCPWSIVDSQLQARLVVEPSEKI